MNVDMQNAYIAGLASGGIVEQNYTPVTATITTAPSLAATVQNYISATVSLEG